MTIHFDHKPGDVDGLVKFFRREVDHLRSLTKIIIRPEKTLIQDINRDTMEFAGLTFGDPALEVLLRELQVVYDAEALRRAAAESREVEYPLSARFPWGWERVSG